MKFVHQERLITEYNSKCVNTQVDQLLFSANDQFSQI